MFTKKRKVDMHMIQALAKLEQDSYNNAPEIGELAARLRAGRGFAVVAGEIRSLADETKQLTDNMGKFMNSIQKAAEESAISVENAISSLGVVNSKILEVWTLNEDNQKHIAGISESINNLATVSEEISSSMNEIEASASNIEISCGALKENAGALQLIGQNCITAIEPLESIETGIDRSLGQMGRMSVDPFYALSRQELTDYITTAI